MGGTSLRQSASDDGHDAGRFRGDTVLLTVFLVLASLPFLPEDQWPSRGALIVLGSAAVALGLAAVLPGVRRWREHVGGAAALVMVTLLAAATGAGESPYTVLYLIVLLHGAVFHSRRQLIGESLLLCGCSAVLITLTDGVDTAETSVVLLRLIALLVMAAVVHGLVGRLRGLTAQLEVSRQHYRSLVRYNPDAVHTFDLDARFTSANPAAAALSGYTPEELRAMPHLPLEALLHPDELEETMRRFRATAAGSPQHFESAIVSRLGERVDLQVATVPIIIDGRVAGVYSVSKDITERKRAERLLHERAAQQAAVGRLGESALASADLTALLQEATCVVAETLRVPLAGVFELQSSGELLVSAGFGWPAGAVGTEVAPAAPPYDTAAALGADSAVVVSDYAEDSAPEAIPLAQAHGAVSGMTVALRSGESLLGLLAVYDVEPRVFSDGERGFVQTVANVLANAISRRRVEQQLLQAQKLQAVGRLAGGIAHDFNNLLTAMLGYCELLQPHVAGDRVANAHLRQALDAGERARALVDQILTFSRGRVGGTGPCDLNGTVRGMEGLLRPLLPEGIEVQVRLTEPLQAVRVDQTQLQQVVLNLALNARDAMPDGGVLSVSSAEVVLDHAVAGGMGIPAGRYVTLTVEDTGTGMDEATAARLFEPFFTTKSDGTGLGLATVYGVVTAAGGQVRVDSQVGRGTRFTVYLPAVPEGIVAEGPRADDGPAPAPVVSATIMVVEDQAAVRSLVCEILSQRGFTVIQATNGMEAHELAAAFDGVVDLLITDVVMPQMQGPELAGLLRRQWPDLRVLYMSGYSSRTHLVGTDEVDVDFLPKPFGVADLVERITTLLSRSPVQAGFGARDGGTHTMAASVPPPQEAP